MLKHKLSTTGKSLKHRNLEILSLGSPGKDKQKEKRKNIYF